MDANDINLLAAERLEAALERLALALEARERRSRDAQERRLLEVLEQARLEARAELAEATQPTDADMVPRAEVERLSARLDEALGRLRALVGDDAGAVI